MSNQPAPDKPAVKSKGLGGLFWQGKIPEAFWKAATLFSFVVNFILVLVLLIAGLLIFQIKTGIAQPIIGGLYTSFIKMDEANIQANIQVNDMITVTDTILVNDTLPVVFDLPLSTVTVVTLTESTVIPNTVVYLNGSPIATNIILPAGSPLKIKLDLIVPVSTTVPVVLRVPVNLKVPVSLKVPVDIPLDKTQLHEPFVNLAKIVEPYNNLLNMLPDSWLGIFTPKPQPAPAETPAPTPQP